jgi:hypothetical protein
MTDSKITGTDLTPAETNLGKALVLLQRAAGRLDDPARHAEVQSTLRQAADFVHAALAAHAGPASTPSLGVQQVATGVEPVIAAVIAAAISVFLDQPYRLVSVQQVSLPVVPHLNVWAVEGRTQIFMSHRVR